MLCFDVGVNEHSYGIIEFRCNQ